MAYDASLGADPNRFRSVYGAAKAADRAGAPARAKAHFEQLALLARDADTERPEIVEAKTYLRQ
jgi:hypothetical protein